MTAVSHFRPTNLGDSGNLPMASNGILNSSGQGGHNGGVSRPGGAPLPHIDDILAIPKDVDANTSLRRLLEMAESSLRQAEMSRDFNRPAIALKEYLRASVIAIQVMGNHRDYNSMKGERDGLERAHKALLQKINQQDEIFRRIKEDIIADNKRTGVQPTVQRVGPRREDGGSFRPMSPPGPQNTTPMTSPRSSTSSSPGRTRPVIQPKPQSLRGNILKPGLGNPPNLATQDLAARFANLRGPQASPGQDPRIKTHPLMLPKPNGPREMPPPLKPKLNLEKVIPSLPKMPDAIYSPARGSISAETPRPPSTTPRGAYSRTGSTVSLSGTPNASPQLQSDYFAPTQSYSNNSIPPTPPGNVMRIPEGSTITPEELFQAMKCKGKILIIDVRAREDFKEGHIMSSSTICIEPSILLREHVSADEICDSLVLAPNDEQVLFEQRQRFDLVVFYDEGTDDIPIYPRNSDEIVIKSLHQALTTFNYGRELKNPAKLLKGGLNSWVDLMGPASLQSSVGGAVKRVQPDRRTRNITRGRSNSKYIVAQLKPDDVAAWQETLKNDDMQTASSPSFLRTTEDFLRRYPPVATDQESMTSPTKTEYKPAYGSSHKIDLYTDLPSPPTRPAPALPRPSYSSLSQNVNEAEFNGHANASAAHKMTAARAQKPAVEQQISTDHARSWTGLSNPGNWCYANSTLQSLIASPDFGRELTNSEWITKYRAPRKDGEKMDHPQLMIRIISNLYHWMSTGNFKAMKAQTLMDYSRHLCNQSRGMEQFGGSQQQDAQEFMSFLLTHLHDETNTRRDRKGQVAQPDTKRQSLLRAAAEYWRNHLEFNQSIIDRYWRGIELSSVECLECHTRTYRFSPFEWIPLTVSMGEGSMTLSQALRHHTSLNTLDDFSCDECRHATRAQQSLSFARLPPLLCVAFRRFHFQQKTGDVRKSTVPLTWDFNDVDFSRYFLPPSECANSPEITDPAFSGPFRYECYAVIVHVGSRVDNGHYFAYVRDSASHDPYAWFCCNDSQVTKVRIGCGGSFDIQGEVLKSGRDQVPYLAFFRRKEMR